MNFWKKSVGSTVSFILFSLTNELIRVSKAQYNGNFRGDKVGVFDRQSGSIGQLEYSSFNLSLVQFMKNIFHYDKISC